MQGIFMPKVGEIVAEARRRRHTLSSKTPTSRTTSGSSARTTHRERHRPPREMVAKYEEDRMAMPGSHR